MSDFSDEDNELGKGRPPRHSQFKPGVSGNPGGRPRGKRPVDTYEKILGQMVTVREDGQEKRMRADAAFMLHISTKALAGDAVMARAALGVLDKTRTSGGASEPPLQIVYFLHAGPGDLRQAVRSSQIAVMLDPYRPTARLALATWVIEEALGRLGDKQLTVDEQHVIVAAARSPHKVRWPEWWSAKCA